MTDVGKIRQIKAQFESFCLSCGDAVHAGEDVFWCIEVGVWHLDCSVPRNLKFEINEARKAHGLSLEG